MFMVPRTLRRSIVLFAWLALAVAVPWRPAAAASPTNIVTHIALDPPTPNILSDGQYLSLTWSYTTDEPGGVRIFARPFTAGALTPGYAASGSPLYPVGSGTGSGSFTITTGDVTVDQIRFQMLNATQSRLLFEAFLPVHYQFTTAKHLVRKIRLAPATPNILINGQNLSLTWDYATTEPNGVRIFARPFTAGALTPGYAASGSPLYPVGSGTGSGSFTITTGDVTVDQIRFQILNADQSKLLFEAFIPVHIQFKSATSMVYTIALDPQTPNILQNGDYVNMRWSYRTNDQGGVRIFARPFSGGLPAPHYAASGSPLYPVGSGTGSGLFTITTGDVTVDQIRFQILNADQSKLLFEAFIPVHYQFGRGSTRVFLPLIMR